MTTSREFIETLITIGYPGAEKLDANEIDYLFYNEKLIPFFSWICNKVKNPANVIQHAELTRYNQLVESGITILKVNELNDVMVTFSLDTNYEEASDIQEEERLMKLKWRSKMNEQWKRLKVQYTTILEEISGIELARVSAKQQLKQAILDCESTNKSVNEIQKSIDSLFRKLFEHVQCPSTTSRSCWMFTMDFDPFWRNFNTTIDQIMAPIQRNFNTEQTKKLDTRDTDQMWRQLFRDGKLKSEVDLFQTEMKYENTKAVLTKSRKILDSLSICPRAYAQRISRNNKRFGERHAENEAAFNNKILPKLVCICDNELSINVATQYLRKQEEIVKSTAILKQAILDIFDDVARVIFLLKCFNSEHKDLVLIGRLIDDLNENLEMELQSFNKRKETYNQLINSLPRVPFECQPSVSTIFEILRMDESRVLATEKLATVRKELAKMDERRLSQQNTLESKLKLEIDIVSNMSLNLNTLIDSIWQQCSTEDVPPLTPSAITQALKQIAENSAQIQLNLATAMNDQQTKKILVRADKLLPVEQMLYVYFYEDPEKFKLAFEAIRESKKNSLQEKDKHSH